MEELAGVVPHDILIEIVEKVKSGDFDEIKKYVNTFMKSGWSAASVVNQLHEYYITNDNFDTNFKNQISWLLFTTDSRLNNGTNEHIQLLNLLVKISQL